MHTFIVIIYTETNNYIKNKMSDGTKRNKLKYNHSKTAKQLSHISVNEAIQ